MLMERLMVLEELSNFTPVMIAGVGIVASILGTFLVNIKNNEAKEACSKGIDLVLTSIILTLAASYFLIDWMFPSSITMNFFGEGLKQVPSINVFILNIGLAVGALIG